jgi:hypothetical protein
VKSLERRRVGEVWILKRWHSEAIGKKVGDFWILEEEAQWEISN